MSWVSGGRDGFGGGQTEVDSSDAEEGWFSPGTMWVLEIDQAGQQVPLPMNPSV